MIIQQLCLVQNIIVRFARISVLLQKQNTLIYLFSIIFIDTERSHRFCFLFILNKGMELCSCGIFEGAGGPGGMTMGVYPMQAGAVGCEGNVRYILC